MQILIATLWFPLRLYASHSLISLVAKCLSGNILNLLNRLCFKSGGLIRGGVTDVDDGESQGQVRGLLDFLTWISSFEGRTLMPTIASYS
jgi:hypothetical protein